MIRSGGLFHLFDCFRQKIFSFAETFRLNKPFLSNTTYIFLFSLLSIIYFLNFFVPLMDNDAAHHANIALPATLDRAICTVIVTPFMHKVHHSRVLPETNSNFSSGLSLWDHVFGSYMERQNHHQIHFGIEGFDGEERQSVRGLLGTPLFGESPRR